MRYLHSALAPLILFLLIASPVLGQDEGSSGKPDFASTGFYLWFGIAAGIDMAAEDELMRLVRSTSGFPSNTRVEIDNATGFNGRIGYRFGPHLATEAQLEYLPLVDWDILVGSSRTTAFRIRIVTITGNLKLFPLSGRVQPFAFLGGGGAFVKVTSPLVSSSESSSGLVLRGGGGIDIHVSEHIAVSADVSYVLPADALENLDYLSIGGGLQYKF